MTSKIFSCLCFIACVVMAPNGVSGACGSLSNPYPSHPKKTVKNAWNPRTTFIVNSMKKCLTASYRCTTYAGGSDSDHPGNAADCFPGTAGVKATGQNKIDGDKLAAWAKENAVPLKIKYVIWCKRIWSVERASEGWRTCGTSKATCYGGPAITLAHYDHVHISVN
jgi:hypothetical protein